VLQSAGGFQAQAARRRVMVERIVPPGQRGPDGRDRVVIDVPAERLASSDGSAFRAEAGDVVRVFPVSDAVRDRIAVTGSVWAPGPQGFKPGMRLSDALRNAGGVRPDAMMDNVLVTRLLPDSTRRQLRATLTDRAGGVLNDLPLEENDEVQVFAVEHPKASRVYAWSHESGRDGQRRFHAVLGAPPIEDARAAVRVAIVGEVRRAQN
jgi:hypothetical protein